MLFYNLEVVVKTATQTNKLKKIEEASALILSQFLHLIKGTSLQRA